jgi:hypothetical protein
MSTNSPKEFLKQFISRNPNAQYSFDSERNASQSEICRQGKNKECIILQMTSRELFAAMQENGFFCALPMDPTRTYIECKRIGNTP